MTRAVGIDISKWQENFNPDHAVKQIDFVIQRASWGLTKDEKFSIIHQGVKKIPSRGAYHYYSSNVPWQMQADLLLEVTKGKGFKVLVVDYELGYNKLTQRTALECRKIIDYLRKKRPGTKILLYCGAYTYRDFLQPWADFSDVDLMIARYPWLPVVVDKDLPNLLGTRTAWTIWQYSKKGKGSDYGIGSTDVDLDVFNGNVLDMKSYFMVDQQQVPDPEPVPEPILDPVDPPECADCQELKKRAAGVVLAVVELSELL